MKRYYVPVSQLVDADSMLRQETDAEVVLLTELTATRQATLENVKQYRQALEGVQDDVCSLLCPSVWETSKGRPPCHAKCQAIKDALSALPPVKEIP